MSIFTQLGLPPDFEQRKLAECRRILDDENVRALRECGLRIIWPHTSHGLMPVLVLAFDLPEFAGTNAIPSLAVALVSVKKGTLLDVEPDKTILEGDRLRTHLLRSVDHYLTNHGVRLSLDADEAARYSKG